MSEAWAAIIAAIIGSIGTILATKFDDIASLFRRSIRKISGEWRGTLRTVDTGSEGFYPFEAEYDLVIKQAGKKIKAQVIETKVTEGFKPDKYNWKGKVVSDYLVLEGYSEQPEQLLVLSGTLHISPTGRKMRGYLAGNASSRVSSRTWVGYTELEKEG